MTNHSCRICGAPITPSGKRGRVPTACSPECKRARDRLAPGYEQRLTRQREATATRHQHPTLHPCVEEGCTNTREFHSTGRPPSRCERHAQERARRQRKTYPRGSRVSLTKQCSEPSCDRMVIARGVCNPHYKRLLRAEGKLKDEWNDRRRSNYHARRARLNGAGNSGHALLTDIITRDGTDCAACGEPVDLALAYPHRMSKSVDHTIPLSRGGVHALHNTRLMHLTCNLSKGVSLAPATA